MSATPGPLPLDPAAFGLPPAEAPVELVQTHIGWIYLSRSFAFKLKKHVRFDFLDFTTLEQRRWACEREIALNLRLAPDLYLGLLPILPDRNGRPHLSLTPQGLVETGHRVLDWCVWMRRLPSQRMLDILLEQNRVTAGDAEQMAEVLAAFYLGQRGKIQPGGLGDLDSVRANVDENLREGRDLDPSLLPPEALELIAQRANRFLSHHADLIRGRTTKGFVVDGHGDLRAENICLPENVPPVFFDCIEFNDRFRIVDTALDIAFLAMDLDSRGREDLSSALLTRYRKLCDPELPDDLLDFYLGYRAFIKGKVAAWINRDPHVAEAQRDASAAQARMLFDLCVRYALKNTSILFIFCGVAGSGKSSLARTLAARLKCEHVATDFVRDEIVPRGTPPAERYAPAISQLVYQALNDRAVKGLSQHRAIVLDGTFTRAATRAIPLQLARRFNARCILVWANCPADKIAEHIAMRTQNGDVHGSEADLKVAQEQLAGFEPPALSEGFDAICEIDTGGELSTAQSELWRNVMCALRQA